MRPYLVQLKWDNEEQIQKVLNPILFIYGKNDSYVPNWHPKKLNELAINSPITSIYEVEGGNHYDCNYAGGDDYYSTIRSFINSILPQKNTANEKINETFNEAMNEQTNEKINVKKDDKNKEQKNEPNKEKNSKKEGI